MDARLRVSNDMEYDLAPRIDLSLHGVFDLVVKFIWRTRRAVVISQPDI